MSDPVEVHVRLGTEDVPVGRLWSHRGRGVESASFAYDDSWLARPDAHPLEPALPLAGGTFQTAAGVSSFGAFSDSAPDRWGRALIARAEARRARDAGEAARSIAEITYLLGTRDDARQGALRFRRPGGEFLAPAREGVPALMRLPDLLGASERLERDAEDAGDLALLVRAGSSLGGARPKAHVLTRPGVLAIAKFPSARTDAWDVMAWEKTALDLAADSGLRVPANALHDVAGRTVLVIERFDRDGGTRIGYVSAMTMLEARDGQTAAYTDIADVVTAHSSRPDDDLRELWTRMALSVLISNTDDHLRNHGFLRDGAGGWRLAPLFDVNPDPDPGNDELSTAIDAGDTRADVGLLLDVAPYFRLGDGAALAVLARVEAATSRWRDVARANGVDGEGIVRLAPAFEHARRTQARERVAAAT